jgi:peptidyl-prolyl cis-trans isomerase C
MKARHLIGSTLAAAVLALPAALVAQDEKPAAKKPAARPAPIAKVNGVSIPRVRADILVRERTAQGATDSEQLRAAVRDDLINREIIAQEAVRSGLTKRSEFQAELELVRQTVIVQAYLRDWVRKNPPSDAEIQKEYDTAKSQTGDKEYRARHILVDKEDDAKGLIDQLKKGAKFDELAEKHSKDAGNKERGGDLDWNVPGVFDKAFSDAMVKLEKGQMTEAPVHTRFGYHVIRLDDVRPVKFPTLAEVKPRIQQQLTQRKVDQLVRALRAKAKVE